MKRVDGQATPGVGSFRSDRRGVMPSAAVRSDMLSRRHEVPDFRILAKNRRVVSGRRGSVAFVDFAARVWRDRMRNPEIVRRACAEMALIGPFEVRGCAFVDLKTGAGEAAPDGDLAGMGQPKKTKETK